MAGGAAPASSWGRPAPVASARRARCPLTTPTAPSEQKHQEEAMQLVTKSNRQLPLAIALAFACGGQLPKPEPPGVAANLGTKTNNAPTPGPLGNDDPRPST